MQPKPPRPTGVTILGILAIIGGLFGILGGFVLIGAGLIIGALVASVDISNALSQAGYPGLAGLGVELITTVIVLLGVVILIVGILYLATGIGFFGGKGWAWTLGVIVSIISIILSIVQIAAGNFSNILGLVISFLILYYLMQGHVKTFFGKAPAMGTMTTSGMMPASTSTSMGSTQSSSMIRCANCGAMSQAGTMKCPSCGAAL